jgi:hypothetical protein
MRRAYRTEWRARVLKTEELAAKIATMNSVVTFLPTRPGLPIYRWESDSQIAATQIVTRIERSEIRVLLFR